MPTIAELLVELVGCRVSLITRATDMIMVEFKPDDVDDATKAPYNIHAHCPVRFVQGTRLLLGSADMHKSRAKYGDWAAAFDEFHTMYDSIATTLLELLRTRSVRVIGARIGSVGDLIVELTEGMRIEVLPMSSGPHEAWRLFKYEQDHFVYPEDLRSENSSDCP